MEDSLIRKNGQDDSKNGHVHFEKFGNEQIVPPSDQLGLIDTQYDV